MTSMSNDNAQPSGGGRRSTNTLNEGLLSETTKTLNSIGLVIWSDDGYNNKDNEEDNNKDNNDGDGEMTFLRTRVMKTMGMTMRTMRMATGSCDRKDDNVVATQQLWSCSKDDAK